MTATYPELRNEKLLAVDIETYDPGLKELGPSVRRGGGAILGVAVATARDAWYIPLVHAGTLDPDYGGLRWAQEQLGQNQNQVTVGANYLYDLDWLKSVNVHITGPCRDVLLAEALIDETAVGGLDGAAERRLGVRKKKGVLEEAGAALGYPSTSNASCTGSHRTPWQSTPVRMPV